MEEKKLTDEVENVVKVLSDFHKRVLNTKLGESIFESEILAIIYAKELIHRLQDENKALLKENEALYISFYGVQNQARERCEELQKQVDELKEELEKAYEIERANIQAEIAEAGTSCHWCKAKTEKDTAKDIIKWIKLNGILEYGGYVIHDSTIDRMCKKYGVEVE